MKVNSKIKIKPFKFKDNFNIDYSPYYIIENGVYKFLDKLTRLKFEYSFGITCQCKRKIYNGKLEYFYYYDYPIIQSQKDFLKKRALAMNNNQVPAGTEYIKFNCGCKKNDNKKA